MSKRLSTGLLFALALAARAIPAAAADDGHFTITDEMAPDEVSENTDIYIDGKLLAHIHLDAKRPAAAVEGRAANPSATHDYALCGDITVRKETGGVETHEVNSGGTMSDLDGRRFRALGAADFTIFYLADPAPERAPTVPSRSRSTLCHPAVS